MILPLTVSPQLVHSKGEWEVSLELLILFKIIWANSEVHTILHQALNLLKFAPTTQQIMWAPFPILCSAPLPQGGSFYPRLSWPVEHSVPAGPSMLGREPALLPGLQGLVYDHHRATVRENSFSWESCSPPMQQDPSPSSNVNVETGPHYHMIFCAI